MTDVTDVLRRVGELLRALVYIAQPFWKEGPLLLNLDSVVQNDFVVIFRDKLSVIRSTLTESNGSIQVPVSSGEDLSMTISQQVVLLVRLLQFDLGFRGAWTPRLRDLSSELINDLFHLALVRLLILVSILKFISSFLQHYGTADYLNPVVYPLLVDTLLYLIDGKL